jgi:hypothetical protein
MPLTINYAANPQSEWDEKGYLTDPIYGKNELQPESKIYTGPNYTPERTISFVASYLKTIPDVGEFITNTHSWLSENNKGPWYLSDDWTNHGHSLGCYIHIERLDQQENFFKSELGKYFSWNGDPGNKFRFPSLEKEITDLAIIKGIINNYSLDEYLLGWVDANQGFDEDFKKMDNVDYRYITPQHPEIAASCAADLIQMGFEQTEGGSYKARISYSTTEDLEKWKDNVSAITWVRESKRMDDPNFHQIVCRYPDVEEKFKNKWGEHFHHNKETGIYYCSSSEYPTLPKRKIPEEFMDYLYGRGPDPSPKPV